MGWSSQCMQTAGAWPAGNREAWVRPPWQKCLHPVSSTWLNLSGSPNSDPTHSVSMALFILEGLFSPLLPQAWGLLAALENWLWAQGAKPT